MIKQVLLLALLSIICHKAYRFLTFTGYSRMNRRVEEFEPKMCARKYANLTPTDRQLPILNTLDSDMLPNGICMFSSGDYHPFLTANPSLRPTVNEKVKASLFMLDMNYLDRLNPVPLRIVERDSYSNIESDVFNLYSISIYQDENHHFKIVAANYNHSTRTTTIETFTYDTQKYVLVHMDTLNMNNVRNHLNELCDLVVVEDYLIYFTKCFSDFENNQLIKFSLEMKLGEIWLINLKENVLYMVAKGLFMPKSIAYIRSEDFIVVTNLAHDGLSLFRRENDFSLTKMQDIYLDSFVFNVNVDLDNNLWLTLHPLLYQTFDLIKFENPFLKIENNNLTTAKIVRVKIDFKKRHYAGHTLEHVFSTNGTLFNYLSSSIFYNNALILYSFINDPKVCLV
jgi:hypothetical protein